ncbi:hypothetical protein YUBABA_02140 [Serratia phage vB_SmaM-Yubaba]|nr:hypothetical protein SUREIYA_00210 [Serratia phage vB_SmaM-Sureiya]UQT03416.1 hypothetical protein YUBABA_02140 [Serratia phage vB_SmaM-Yubaba]
MFNIDRPSLITAIAISLEPNLRNVEDKQPEYIKYFHVVLDMALGVMNSKIRNIDDAIDEQYSLYPDDKNLPWLAETVRQLVVDIKTQFIQAGFDNRLKYKIVTRPIGLHKLYGIGMDLEATMASMMSSLPDGTEEVEETLMVSENPTYEQLEAAYNW